MSIEAVKAYFDALGMEGQVMEKPTSSATVPLAAAALGVIPARIVKTLSFMANGQCVLISTAGDAKIDNAKYRAQFGCKAKMLTADEVLLHTGHAVGGVCPFALPPSVQVYVDVSVKRFQSVFPAAGSQNSMIELTPDALFRCAGALSWVDVCKDWQSEAG